MQQNIHENSQVLQQIEWTFITKIIKDLSHFDGTPHQILKYCNSISEIQEILQTTQQYEEYFYDNDFKSLIEDTHSLSETFQFLDKSKEIVKQKSLQLSELNEFAKLLEIYFDHVKTIEKKFSHKIIQEDFSKFKRLTQKEFLVSFRKFVAKDGDVDLSKHPIIRPLFEKQIQIETKIRNILNTTLRNDSFQNKIQYSSIDIINDRYVIPIKSDSYQGKIGQIISRSDSGNTLYVEPSAIAGLNYSRIEIIVEIQAILSKLELDITKSLIPFHNDLWKISRFFYTCDEFMTRVLFAQRLSLTLPEISITKEIILKNAFHPLIERPVKNDISILNTDYGMIISGPNTGGKTATLKTLALTQLFLKFGLYIPCDHGKVFPYEKTFYFGNDQQNLDQGLSSFSAEVKNYATLFDALGGTNLILIDEIFNSTSSEEASALAIAFFKEVHDVSNVHFIVSSHHQTLKTILHQDTNYISAHVGFDAETNEPTYKLHCGTPGSSHALKIFQNLTQGKEHFQNIYKHSLNFLDHKVIHYEKLLESIAEKEHKLHKTLSENTELNKQLKNQKQSMEGVIKLKIQERVQSAEKKLKTLQEKAEYIVKETKKGNINKQRQIDNQFSSLKQEVHTLAPLKEDVPARSIPENLSTPRVLHEGQEYFCLSLQKTITLKRIERNKKYCQVSAGSISMKVEAKSLMLANQSGHTATNTIDSSYTTSRTVQLEYDCRGMRLEEFQSLIEDVTSDLLLATIPYVSIIHGHGTGVLKNWLRKHVKSAKNLTVLKDQSGNDGETRFALL
jgi:DNA mismatch repair protein MutS2